MATKSFPKLSKKASTTIIAALKNTRRPRNRSAGEESSHFLSPQALAQGAREVAVIAKSARVEVVLVGGYALQTYGSPRLTGDLDVVAKTIPATVSGTPLTFGGRSATTVSGVPFDWIVRKDAYAALYKAALRARRIRSGVALPVAPLEYLVAMKMAAHRTRDVQHLEFIVLHPQFNVARACAIVGRYLGQYAKDELDQLVQVTRWKRDKGFL